MTNLANSSSVYGKLTRLLAISVIAVGFAGCASKGSITTGSVSKFNKPLSQMNASELGSAANTVGARYSKNPKDAGIAMQYASILQMNGQFQYEE